MPKRLVYLSIGVAFLFLMGKRAPPVFHDFDHISLPFKHRNADWAVPGAIQNPVQFVLGKA
jgi:hypothetical protein